MCNKISSNRLLIFSLCVLIIFSLSACSKKPTAATAVSASGGDRMGYTLSRLPFPDGISLSTTQHLYGEDLYLGGFDAEGIAVFGKYSGDAFTKYELPEGTEYVYACFADENGAYALVGDYPLFWDDVNGNTHYDENHGETAMNIIRFDSNGILLLSISINDPLVTEINYRSLLSFNGYFYLLSTSGYAVLDGEGHCLKLLIEEKSRFVSQCISGKGIMLCAANIQANDNDNSTKIYELSRDFNLNAVYSNSEDYICGFGVSANGDYLLNNYGSIVKLSPNGDSQELFSLSQLGSSLLEYRDIFECDSGYLLSTRDLSSIVKINYGETSERTRLRLLAAVNSPAVAAAAAMFNESNSEYYISVEYLSDMTPEQLNAMIASGEGPDIYTLFGTSFSDSVAPSAVFEDLRPFIAVDAEYSDALLPSLSKALDNDGSLYVMPLDFMIWTFCADKDKLPGDILNADAQIFSSSMGRDDLWYWISNLYLSSHLDKEHKSVDFENEEFIRLMEMCAKASAEQSPVFDMGIVHLEQIPGLLRLEYLREQFGNRYSLNTSMGSAFSIQQSFAISNQSQHKDGAWQFVRQALSPNFPQSDDMCLPSSQAGFNALVSQGVNGEVWNITGPIEITEYEADQLRELLDNTYCLLDEYPMVIEIMREEAEKTFVGDRSAEATAQVIQSRVSVLMAERYG